MILPRASPAQVTWQLWNRHWTGAVRNDEPRIVISCSRTGDWNVGKTLSTWRHRTWWDLPGLPSLIKNWSREWPGNEAKLVFHNTNKSHKSCVKSCDHVPLGLMNIYKWPLTSDFIAHSLNQWIRISYVTWYVQTLAWLVTQNMQKRKWSTAKHPHWRLYIHACLSVILAFDTTRAPPSNTMLPPPVIN